MEHLREPVHLLVPLNEGPRLALATMRLAAALEEFRWAMEDAESWKDVRGVTG